MLASTAPAAAEANGLGEKGQLILSADRLVPIFGYTNRSVTETQNNGATVTRSTSASGISLLFGRDSGLDSVHTVPRVAADFTIIPRLTLGAAIAVGFGFGGSVETEIKQPNGNTTTQSNDAPTTTTFGIVPRVGYIIPLGDVLAFWPRAGFGFYTVTVKDEDVNNNVTTSTSINQTLFSLDLDPQLAIVPVEHFFFHVGPLVNIPITGSQSTKTTVGSTTTERSDDLSVFHLGISAGVGGWLNL